MNKKEIRDEYKSKTNPSDKGLREFEKQLKESDERLPCSHCMELFVPVKEEGLCQKCQGLLR